MSGHRSSRRRDYGRRQRDVRARRGDALPVEIEAPVAWARGRAWDTRSSQPGTRLTRSDPTDPSRLASLGDPHIAARSAASEGGSIDSRGH